MSATAEPAVAAEVTTAPVAVATTTETPAPAPTTTTPTPTPTETAPVAATTATPEATATSSSSSSSSASSSSTSSSSTESKEVKSSYVPPLPSIFAPVTSSPTLVAALLASTTITPSTPHPVYSHPPLRAAEPHDLTEGAIIYVRGRRAVVKRLDFPLVFWQSDGDEAEKHRSFDADRPMFMVEATGGASSSSSAGTATVEGKTEEKKATEAGVEAFPSKEEAAKALAGVIGSSGREKVTEYKSLKNQEAIHCEARFPGSVYVEDCEESCIYVPEKVSAITLVNCRAVTVRFVSVIARTELIRCHQCVVVCGAVCASYALDSCVECRLVFPSGSKEAEAVTWVTQHSSGTRLIARGEEAAAAEAKEDSKESEATPRSGDIVHEIVETKDTAPPTAAAAPATPAPTTEAPTTPATEGAATPAAATGDAAAAAPAAGAGAGAGAGGAPAADAPPQFRTRYHAGAFTTAQLVREGPLGYTTSR